jgi:ATP-dependent helicase YprA (DUF1998 family)
VHLGHTFESDVLTIEFPASAMTRDAALSTLYAVLAAGCDLLGIEQDDVGGSLYGNATVGQTLVLFDTVPGGAGHVRRIGRRLSDVLRAARQRVETCSCGIETSCYECLRSYSNQFEHQFLTRRDALQVLNIAVERL